MDTVAKTLGHWLYVNIFPLVALIIFLVAALNIAQKIEAEFTVAFTYQEADNIATKWEDDVERVQNFAEQLSFLANFIRLKFDTPINFSQKIIIDVSRRELAAGAATPIESASQPADGRITAEGMVNFTSAEVTLCDLQILNEPFAIAELRTRVQTLRENLLPKCVDIYLQQNSLGATRREDIGSITSLIAVSPDPLSKNAIKVVSILLLASLVLVILKVFTTFRKIFSLRA